MTTPDILLLGAERPNISELTVAQLVLITMNWDRTYFVTVKELVQKTHAQRVRFFQDMAAKGRFNQNMTDTEYLLYEATRLGDNTLLKLNYAMILANSMLLDAGNYDPVYSKEDYAAIPDVGLIIQEIRDIQ